MHLTVHHPFTVQKIVKTEDGKEVPEMKVFERGDKIYDADLIAEVMNGENRTHVVRTAGDKP